MASNPLHDQLFAAFRRLKAGWPSRGWSWDSRMTCITSSFSSEFEANAKTAVMEALPIEWSASSYTKAPPNLREYVDRYGGLRNGQFLFSSGATGGSLVAFGLWWPWQDAETVSVRIGFPDVDPGREPYARLRDVFGVQL
jgi:hypothetical protein